MNKLLYTVLAGALLLPLSVRAQDGPPTMVTSSWQCSFGYIGDLTSEMRDVALPIAQEMVDDGTIINWGMMTHYWGDEWNVMFYVAVPNGAIATEVASDLNGRQNQAFSDETNEAFLENCWQHKDSVYTWQLATSGGEPSDDINMGLSFWKCNFGFTGDLIDVVEEGGLPVAQEMVDSGDVFAWGLMTHAWGDEWNVMFYAAVNGDKDFLDVTSTLQGQQFSAYGAENNALFVENCTEHRDNIYSMAMFTQPAGE